MFPPLECPIPGAYPLEEGEQREVLRNAEPWVRDDLARDKNIMDKLSAHAPVEIRDALGLPPRVISAWDTRPESNVFQGADTFNAGSSKGSIGAEAKTAKKGSKDWPRYGVVRRTVCKDRCEFPTSVGVDRV
jgi:hypothetical protein